MRSFRTVLVALVLALMSVPVFAQEPSYFVTYDHYLEEPGNLEIAVVSTTGLPKHDHAAYTAPWLELEYGMTGWWTAELYLEGVTTRGDGSAFTGWRWENRFRPFKAEHRLNPVIYVEFENVNEASRIQKEIVGDGPVAFEPIAQLKHERARELEGRLILSSVVGAWNVSENVIMEKNFSEDEGVEFGYSIGAARPLGTLASATACRFCRENFVAGLEMYGGLGNTDAFGLHGARHYVAPVFGWRFSDRSTVKISTGFGLTGVSDRFLVRVGWTYEMSTRRRP